MKTTPIRLGIVGLGRAGWDMHCKEIQDKGHLYTLVAACDPVPERRDRAARQYGCRVYERIEDLVADPTVELVDIATRSVDHYAHARLALKAGKAVFLEKPMCATYAEARRLVAFARRIKGRLYVRHNRRFEPAFLDIREIMDAGLLGEVFEIKLRRVSYQRRNDWQTLRAYAGGQLLNWGPHLVDHGLRLLDAPLARVWSDLKHIAAAGDCEDHLKIILTGRNHRIVDIEISGGVAIRVPEWTVWGTRGALTCSGATLSLKYLDPRQRLAPPKADPETPGLHPLRPVPLRWIEKTVPLNLRGDSVLGAIWVELYNTIRLKRPFPIRLEEALEVMKVLDQAARPSDGLTVWSEPRRRARS